MTVTRDQLEKALIGLRNYAYWEAANHDDLSLDVIETIRTVLQSALDGMDAPDTAALDAATEMYAALGDSEKWCDKFGLVRAALTRPSVGDDQLTIDLDKESWDVIKQSASKSKWIPKEYFMNDWVSDVCDFLENGASAPKGGE